MLASRQCQRLAGGFARVLAAALARQCTASSLYAFGPHVTASATITTAPATALISPRWFSQVAQEDPEQLPQHGEKEGHAQQEEGHGAWARNGFEGQQDEHNPQHEVEQQRQRLLEMALNHVGTLGWSRAALEAAAGDLGLSRSSAGIVARGEVQLVEFFMSRCNRELEGLLRALEPELSGMRTRERVCTGVKVRLEMNQPYINTWAQALSLQSRPEAAARALQQRADIADIIWHAAGDKSTDYNWYTKRGLLLGVYSATELYMLTDASPGFSDTWAALDRRLDDVMRLGKAVGGVAGAVKEAGAVLTALAAAAGRPK